MGKPEACRNSTILVIEQLMQLLGTRKKNFKIKKHGQVYYKLSDV